MLRAKPSKYLLALMQLSCEISHPAVLKSNIKSDTTYTSYCNGGTDSDLWEISAVKRCFLTDKACNKKSSKMDGSSVDLSVQPMRAQRTLWRPCELISEGFK